MDSISSGRSGGPPAVSNLLVVSLSLITRLQLSVRSVPPLCTMISCKGPQTRYHSRFLRSKYANSNACLYVRLKGRMYVSILSGSGNAEHRSSWPELMAPWPIARARVPCASWPIARARVPCASAVHAGLFCTPRRICASAVHAPPRVPLVARKSS